MKPTTLAQQLTDPTSMEPALIGEARQRTARASLAELLADPGSSASAIVTTSPPAVVSYKALADQIERLSGQFSNAGLKPGDCVAIVLPNSLEFLVIVLALTRARLVAAPLNPAYKPDETCYFIKNAQAKALVVEGVSGAVREATAGLGVPVWTPHVDARGVVGLLELPQASRTTLDAPDPDDVALFVYTSGTTGRPKCVPLTHANIVWSSRNIAAHYALTSADRSLVVMPLFHGHGLIGSTLSTLASGGCVIVPPRFSASAFWGQFREHRATWYSAVPTIHQVLLARADSDGAPSSGPRFIRSCSAALAPTILTRLEHRFGAPVLEAYGMTEAAHQVASNPLPPLPHKPGTVGPGDEISIIDEAGRHLAANVPGEVVVRGPNVMRGYRNDPDANASAFIDGWFRTGDTGALDGDGYLTLLGHTKEMINRGGEKISPEEVEAVLLQHPAVAEAAAFGVPDAKYGEEIWAAVVLRSPTDPQELQAFCSSRLADFKVPKVIHVVSTLPKNATGKVQRRDLAALFKVPPKQADPAIALEKSAASASPKKHVAKGV
ncbi:MAG: oxalate--CoA ligase-like [Spartobacteria bacterium]|nr:oxalate--CoA ligase-like [Spartobacteria bacterium]